MNRGEDQQLAFIHGECLLAFAKIKCGANWLRPLRADQFQLGLAWRVGLQWQPLQRKRGKNRALKYLRIRNGARLGFHGPHVPTTFHFHTDGNRHQRARAHRAAWNFAGGAYRVARVTESLGRGRLEFASDSNLRLRPQNLSVSNRDRQSRGHGHDPTQIQVLHFHMNEPSTL